MKKISIFTLFFILFCQSAFGAVTAIKCNSNDDCPNKKACIGARTGSVRCIDKPNDAACANCRNQTGSPYSIPGFANKINMDCLEKTTIGGIPSLNGYCQLDSLTLGICHTYKILKDGIAKYLVMIAVIIIGFNFLMGGGKVNINSVLIILAGIMLIYGGFQLINMITGVDAAAACQ